MSDPPTDEQLLRRFVKGDESALGELASRHEPALVGLARAMLGGDADAARDAVQESWVRVITAAPRFQHRSGVKTWIYRIVINRCIDLRRTRQPLPLDLRHESDAPQSPDLRTPDPGAALDAGETARQLHAALDALSGEARLLLLLCYHEGLTHPQAADVLGIPVGTLKSRLHTALAQLRTRLNPTAEVTP